MSVEVVLTMQKYGKSLRFNTKGVKNFSDLTIFKSRKRKTAHIIAKFTMNDEHMNPRTQ